MLWPELKVEGQGQSSIHVSNLPSPSDQLISSISVLTKTMRTGKNLNEDKIARLVNAAPFSGGLFYKALYAKQKKDKKDSKKGPGDRGSSARMRDGEAVGEGAERIGIDNIGHQLLSRMGWAEGSRIGRSEGGLENP